jgi:hypothetical protein
MKKFKSYYKFRLSGYFNFLSRGKILAISIILLNYLMPLLAQTSNQDLKEAQAYFESENYTKSQAIYEGLLDDEMALWQQQILHYNSATSLLSAGKSDEAIVQLEVLSNERIGLPQLKQRVLSNLVLARLMQLNDHIAGLENPSETSYLDYNRIFMLFYKIFQDINKANEAWCELEAAEGAASCTPSIYLQEMQMETENTLKIFLAKNQKSSFDFAYGSVEEALQQLSMSYGLALIKDPLQKPLLEKILENQTAFGDGFLKNAESSQKADFEKAQKYLKFSIKSLKGTDVISARIFWKMLILLLKHNQKTFWKTRLQKWS